VTLRQPDRSTSPYLAGLGELTIRQPLAVARVSGVSIVHQ